MSEVIPENLRHSKAVKFVVEQGWKWEPASGDQIKVEVCPYCKKGNYKCFFATGDPNDPQNTRDGLHFCHHGSCGRTGNIRTLSEHLGLRIAGVDSRKEWAGNAKGDRPDELPDVDVCHRALLGDPLALDYLLHNRGFTQEVINKQKLGLKEKVYFRGVGEVKALVIPYLSVEGNVTFAKYRTMPPNDKAFASPTGWEAGLYNAPALNPDCKEIIMVEGEADCLSLLSKGVTNVVGVPGANVHKAAWIETLDRLEPKVYILYDSDGPGTKGAQALASRIGIDKCWKIELPKDIKDINEFFCKGGTVEAFEGLKAAARLFDVSGVTSSKDALTQLEDELNGRSDLAPSYVFQWPELNKLIGLEDGDILDIVAPEKVGKTTMGMNIMDHMVGQYGEDGLIVCLEMTQARLARKWVALVTGFEDVLTEPGTPESKAKLEELKAACVTARSVQQSRDADLYFAYPMQWQDDPESVFKLIKDCIRRYGVKWVMFDNLQKFCDESLKSQGHRTIYLSQLSKKFASIAKDYKIKLIRILQPKRIEKGATISTNDVDGSSQVAKDCDGMITLWRSVVGELKKSEWETQQQGFEESNESFEPIMKVTVGLSRYSAGGSTKLFYDGVRSQVRSIKDEQKAVMKPNFNGIVTESGATVPVQTEAETPHEVPKEDISI